MAGSAALKPFASIAVIDDLLKEYQGAYTHDQIFSFNLNWAYSQRLYHQQVKQYHERYNKVLNQFRNESKQKRR